MLAFCLDKDTLQKITYLEVRNHFYHLWSSLRLETVLWNGIRSYCDRHNEPAVYLAAMLIGHSLSQQPQLHPRNCPARQVWPQAEKRLEVLGIRPRQTIPLTDQPPPNPRLKQTA